MSRGPSPWAARLKSVGTHTVYGVGLYLAAELVRRLNIQVSKHAPPSRFITLFLGLFDPTTGDLEFAGFDGNLLRVRLKGACAGCPRSALDLKQVVETLVRRRYPAIREVRNVEPPPGGNP